MVPYLHHKKTPTTYEPDFEKKRKGLISDTIWLGNSDISISTHECVGLLSNPGHLTSSKKFL